MKNQPVLQDDNDFEEITIYEAMHHQRMRMIELITLEKILIEKIGKLLGFSLNDDDAQEKLNQLSNTIKIPPILYHVR